MASDVGGLVPGVSAVIDTSISEQTVDSRLIIPFTQPPGLVGISSVFCHVIEPTKPLSRTNNEIHFLLPDTLNSYIDLKNIKFYIRGSFTRKNGDKLEESEAVSIADNFSHSLFDSVTLLLGKNQIEIQHNMYSFKAYVKQLQRYSQKCVEMSKAGLTVDAPLDSLSDMNDAIARIPYIAGSNEVEFTDHVLADWFTTEGYLIPSFPVQIRFKRNSPSFYTVKSAKNTHSYVFNIEEFTLKVPCVIVQHDIADMLSRQLDNASANYRFTGTNALQYCITKDTLTCKFSRVFQGKLPSRLLVTFYEQEAFLGSDTTLPLTTYNVNVQNISLSINSVIVRQYNVKFHENMYLELYDRFLEYMNVDKTDYYIPFEQFVNGHRYYPFILSQKPDGMNTLPVQALNQGFLDIGLTLAERPSKDLIMVVYYESPECLSITKDRMARFDPVLS